MRYLPILLLLTACSAAPVAPSALDSPAWGTYAYPGEPPIVQDAPRLKVPDGETEALSVRSMFYVTGSAELSNDAILNFNGLRNLEWHARYIMMHPEVRVVIEGYCDERGSEMYNLDLGLRRADNVFDFLIGAGVPASSLSMISYGRSHPVGTCHSEKCWRQNRRVDLVYQYVL